jgi:hypothetical protein
MENARTQQENRREMTKKIEAAIKGCRTLKQAKEQLPEFTKYLPKEAEVTRNVPVVTGLVEELSALGWPTRLA